MSNLWIYDEMYCTAVRIYSEARESSELAEKSLSSARSALVSAEEAVESAKMSEAMTLKFYNDMRKVLEDAVEKEAAEKEKKSVELELGVLPAVPNSPRGE